MEGGHYESMFNLRLWRGQEVEALKLATEKGELNDYLISVAPMGNVCTLTNDIIRPGFKGQAFIKRAHPQQGNVWACMTLYEGIN